MGNTFVINGLMERAGIIKGEIAASEKLLDRQRTDLAHVLATLRMFDPAYEGKRIYPRRPASQRSAHFVQGEITRRCFEAMREVSAPVSAADITERTMTDKDLDPEDRKLRSDMIRRFLYALQRLAKDKVVRRIGHGIGATWTLPSTEATDLQSGRMRG
jgi:hypothetical protein